MSIYRYRQYRKVLKATPFKGRYMPYGWGSLPNSLPFGWMAYSEMFEEFSREIANIINDLSRYTHQLTAWRDVVAGLDDDGKMSVAVEFVDPLATITLNLPYVIRSRFIFAVAHLCHQANRAKQLNDWKDDLPLDDQVYFAQADTYGALWKRYKKLKKSLEYIGAKDYQVTTINFRNTYNHRFSPRVVIGETQIITRNVDPETKMVRYSYGGTSPLTLEVVVLLLEQQYSHCYKAFECFQELVREHEEAISATLVQEM